MFVEDDFDLTKQYYRLRDQQLYYRQILGHYDRYGELTSALIQLSSLGEGFVHDLGNGLNGIRSKLGRLPGDDPHDRSYWQALLQATAICDACGWRLRSFQEVSPSLPQFPEPVNLPEFIPRILKTVAATQPPSIQVRFQTNESRLIVANYSFRLQLALLELLLNAFEAVSPEGRIEVTLVKQEDTLAQIEIRDNGPGWLSHKPEACIDLRMSTGPYRYGLGLHIARGIIEAHRGRLILKARPEGGAQVIVQLPTGNPEPDWEDEGTLVQELERLYDEVAEQKQKIAVCEAEYQQPRAQFLTQLADLFGEVSAATVQFIEAGLADIQRHLEPLVDEITTDEREQIEFILEKCEYCNFVLGNPRVLDPALVLNRAPVYLNALIEQVVQLMGWRVQPGASIDLKLALSLPPVQVDRRLMGTTLVNLLRNALDAAGRDGSIELKTRATERTVILWVTNTGRVIPLDQRTRIFELDYTSRQGREFGLGLYVAQIIATKHEGSITMQEVLRISTRFELILPRGTGAKR